MLKRTDTKVSTDHDTAEAEFEEHEAHIGEGMTEYTLDGELVGYGLSEYLDQPED